MSVDQNAYIKSGAVVIGRIQDREVWVVESPMMKKWRAEDESYRRLLRRQLGGLNGYAVFPKGWLKEGAYGGILAYVPVHWGITYNETSELGQVFGFDTGHADSEKFPREDPKWIQQQLTQMVIGLEKAHEVERSYLRCTTNKGKAKWAQMVLDTCDHKEDNFSFMINMLTGEL